MSARNRSSVVILCADDFAMTEGVTRSIETLAAAGRLSAASALVTTPHWSAHAPRLAVLRDRIAIGLHFNLTLGRPLGPCRKLAPNGTYPSIGALTRQAMARAVDPEEVRAETERQIAAFRGATGFAPDFIDGHQHVHALPRIRDGFIAAIAHVFTADRPLVRDPADTLGTILARGVAVAKSTALAGLAFGFGSAIAKAGFPANDTFSGVTDFRPDETERDIRQALLHPGRLHLVMCHPGFPDAELAALDPVTTRRQVEHDVLMKDERIAAAIWRPSRASDGPPIDWSLV